MNRLTDQQKFVRNAANNHVRNVQNVLNVMIVTMATEIIISREDSREKTDHMDRDRMMVHQVATEDRAAETILGVTITPEIAKVIRTIRVVLRVMAITQVITALVTIMNAIREEMKDRTIDSKKVEQVRDSLKNLSLRKQKAREKNRED